MMSENVERIERYLQGVAVPRDVSDAHRQQLRRRVLAEIGRKPAILSMPGASWKMAVAAVVCIAGAVGAFVELKHRGTGPERGGVYQLISNNHQNMSPRNASDANGAMNTAPAGKDLEIISLLRQQDNLNLVSVIESEVNGRLDSRALLCQYAAPEGLMKTLGAGDPNVKEDSPLTSLPAAAWTEISQLRRSGKAENLGTQVQAVKGRAFVFTRERYTLHNGTKVTLSVGAPRETEPSPK